MDAELNAFLDVMEREHGYRPRLLPSGVLMNSRDADRYEGWLLNHRHSVGDGEDKPTFGGVQARWVEGMGWAIPCSDAKTYVAAMLRDVNAAREGERG